MSACASTPPAQLVRTETVEVRVPVYVPLPEADLRTCLVPSYPDRATVGALRDLIASLYTSLYLCDAQVERIREAQPSVEKTDDGSSTSGNGGTDDAGGS